MPQDLLSSIKVLLSTMTKKERTIAEYILHHAEKVQYMSISILADACGVGETSIFRLCKRLGRKGYQDFKMALAHTVSQAAGLISLPDCIVGLEDDLPAMTQKVLNNSFSILQETFHFLDVHVLRTATDWLLQAERICFFGIGTSSSTAMEAQSRFLRFCPKVEALPDFRIQYMRASLMTGQDVAVFFSYTGNSREILTTSKAARQRGAKTIAITHSAQSPLALQSDLLFLCGGNDSPYESNSLSVKTAQLFLAEVLAISYRLADQQRRVAGQVLARQALQSEFTI